MFECWNKVIIVLQFQVKLNKVWDNPEGKKFENTIQHLTFYVSYRWKNFSEPKTFLFLIVRHSIQISTPYNQKLYHPPTPRRE